MTETIRQIITAATGAAVLMLTAVGCGGGELSSAVGNTNPSVSVSLGTPSLSATMSDGSKNVSLTFACSSQDLFIVDCVIEKVRVGIMDLSYDVPVNAIMKAGETRTVEVPVFTNSHRELEPFNYLRDINPSTSQTNWSVYSDVLASPSSVLIGTGSETTVADPKDTSKKITVPVNSFSSTLPANTPGTVRVTDGSQILDETTFGYLSGSGSGTIAGDSLNVSFSSPPPKGSLIVGMYLSRLNDVVAPQTTNLKLVYDDLSLTQSGTLLQDAAGKIYATIKDNKITVVRPMGFRNAPLVAVYEGPPYNAFGGALLGYADGVSNVYTMKTRFAPIVHKSAKVFTEHSAATVHLENPYTGELTFSFPSPPGKGEAIKVSYVLGSVNTTIALDVITSRGNTKFNIPFTVAK